MHAEPSRKKFERLRVWMEIDALLDQGGASSTLTIHSEDIAEVVHDVLHLLALLNRKVISVTVDGDERECRDPTALLHGIEPQTADSGCSHYLTVLYKGYARTLM